MEKKERKYIKLSFILIVIIGGIIYSNQTYSQIIYNDSYFWDKPSKKNYQRKVSSNKKIDLRIVLFENSHISKQIFIDDCLVQIAQILEPYNISLSLSPSFEKEYFSNSLRFTSVYNLYFENTDYVYKAKKYILYGNEIVIANVSKRYIEYYLLNLIGKTLDFSVDQTGFMSDIPSIEIGEKTKIDLENISKIFETPKSNGGLNSNGIYIMSKSEAERFLK